MANLYEKSLLLSEHPGIGRRDPERSELRIFVVGSYLIIYRELDGGVEVLRYVHGRRDLPNVI